MLNCILSMVEKTRRALGILQQRTTNDPSAGEMASLHQYSHWHVQQQQLKPAHPRREANSHQTHHQHQQQQAYDASELRRQAGELIAQTLKATEDRVSQVKRKAGLSKIQNSNRVHFKTLPSSILLQRRPFMT